MKEHEPYMHRCLELARMGAGYTAPNPMVGSLLHHEGRIIGEGYHRQYGGPHAEIECLENVSREDRSLIPSSTLYVSLEPCAHTGKTPPCTDRIIREKIPRVVIACRDPFPQVDGKGIEKLKAAGVEVINGVLEKEAMDLNKRFFCFHTRQRPFIVLKWAQTTDHKIAGPNRERLRISHPFTNRLVHRWRSEEASILVGTNTALFDDPALTNRLWSGPSPVRLVLDMNQRLPAGLKIFDRSAPTVIFHSGRDEEKNGIRYKNINPANELVPQLVSKIYGMNLLSVMVEGGARLLQSFFDAGLWDEARVITGSATHPSAGLPAPLLPEDSMMEEKYMAEPDTIQFYYRNPA